GHARPRRLWPGKLELSADQPVGERDALDQHAHGQRSGVPAAGGKRAEQGPRRAFLAQVKRLRVELCGETLDLFGIDEMRGAGEALTDVQIFEIETHGRGL